MKVFSNFFLSMFKVLIRQRTIIYPSITENIPHISKSQKTTLLFTGTPVLWFVRIYRCNIVYRCSQITGNYQYTKNTTSLSMFYELLTVPLTSDRKECSMRTLETAGNGYTENWSRCTNPIHSCLGTCNCLRYKPICPTATRGSWFSCRSYLNDSWWFVIAMHA